MHLQVVSLRLQGSLVFFSDYEVMDCVCVCVWWQHLLGDTDELWEVLCKRDFRSSHLDEFESWREQYLASITECVSDLNTLHCILCM